MSNAFEFWFRPQVTTPLNVRRSTFFDNLSCICMITEVNRLYIPTFFQTLSHHLMVYCRQLRTDGLRQSTATQFLDTMQLTANDIRAAWQLSHNLYSQAKKHGVRFIKMTEVLHQEYVYCYFQYLSGFTTNRNQYIIESYKQIYRDLLYMINPDFIRYLDKKIDMFAHNVRNGVLEPEDE